eukprot:748309-Hanusia_phi.AAC.6
MEGNMDSPNFPRSEGAVGEDARERSVADVLDRLSRTLTTFLHDCDRRNLSVVLLVRIAQVVFEPLPDSLNFTMEVIKFVINHMMTMTMMMMMLTLTTIIMILRGRKWSHLHTQVGILGASCDATCSRFGKTCHAREFDFEEEEEGGEANKD